MHYRNGREAKNGDKIVQIDKAARSTAMGVLHSACPATTTATATSRRSKRRTPWRACATACTLTTWPRCSKEKSLEKRPEGK
jgi:hypothetical protein